MSIKVGDIVTLVDGSLVRVEEVLEDGLFDVSNHHDSFQVDGSYIVSYDLIIQENKSPLKFSIRSTFNEDWIIEKSEAEMIEDTRNAYEEMINRCRKPFTTDNVGNRNVHFVIVDKVCPAGAKIRIEGRVGFITWPLLFPTSIVHCIEVDKEVEDVG